MLSIGEIRIILQFRLKMLWLIVITILLVLLIRFLTKTDAALEKLPGPLRLPVIGSIFTQNVSGTTTSKSFEEFLNFVKLYGYRFVIKSFNRYIIHVYNPKDVEVVLSHSRNITKHKAYNFMIPWLGTGLLVSTGSKWHSRRKILTPAFHFGILKNFAEVMEKQSQESIALLTANLKAGHDVVNITSVIYNYTLNVICETAMGTRLQSETKQAREKYKESLATIGMLILRRLCRFWEHNDFIFNLLPSGKQFQKSLSQNHQFTDSIIADRKKQREAGDAIVSDDNKRLAFLDLLLDAESKGKIDMQGIREEVNTFMFEGHDTVGVALSFGLMLISDHEEVQNRLFEECFSIFGNSNRTANLCDLADMKYLEAVIKEIMRMYPSVPYIGRTIEEDFMLDDILVRKGTEVVVHIYDIHHRADLFPEPEQFNPERFLNENKIMNFSYIPFSAGPRNCIGQRFAMQGMKYFFSDVIRNFKMYPIVKGARPKIKADVVLRTDEPIYVQFEKRS